MRSNFASTERILKEAKLQEGIAYNSDYATFEVKQALKSLCRGVGANKQKKSPSLKSSNHHCQSEESDSADSSQIVMNAFNCVT